MAAGIFLDKSIPGGGKMEVYIIWIALWGKAWNLIS